MKVLVIGSGGREHALCYGLKHSSSVETVFCAPGNAGIAEHADCVKLGDHESIIAFCKLQGINLVVVGPEQPLVDGLADTLRAASIKVFGCSAQAAQLEGSKGFTKDICAKYNIPTGAYGRFEDAASAKSYLEGKDYPIVIKADGLAAGKGVIIAQSETEAFTTIDEMFGGKFGAASSEIVIEAFLEGEELSFFALADGERAVEFGSAQDHKTVGEGDTGPNTGGMGTYAPAPMVTDELRSQIMERIITPTVHAMKEEGMPFHGVLFAGLMITKNGPELIEYNVRFGDPEAQVLMARLDDDLGKILYAAASGDLPEKPVNFKDDAALCVVLASEGYPNAYEKGTEIKNVHAASAMEDVTVFHAGTAKDGDALTAIGGRVLGVTALGTDVATAQKKAYAAVDIIEWPQGFCRRDIGWRAIERLKAAS